MKEVVNNKKDREKMEEAVVASDKKASLIMLKKPIQMRVKKQMPGLVKRDTCPIMGGNMWLIKHLFEYLSLRDQLSVMSVNYASYKLLRDDNRFWYMLWRGKKYAKPLGYNVSHNGPLKYGCISPYIMGYYYGYNNVPAGLQPLYGRLTDVNMKDVEITKEDKEMLSGFHQYNGRNSKYFRMIFGGGMCKATSNKIAGNPYGLFECARKMHANGYCYHTRNLDELSRDHWVVKEKHPLSYYGKEYDSTRDYYMEILKQGNLSELSAKLVGAENQMKNINWQLETFERQKVAWEESSKKIKGVVEGLKLAIEITKKYQSEVPSPTSPSK